MDRANVVREFPADIPVHSITLVIFRRQHAIRDIMMAGRLNEPNNVLELH